jgi:membrane protein
VGRRSQHAERRPAPPDGRTEVVEPQPERTEPRLRDPGVADLSRRDYLAVARRAVKESLDDGITDAAAAVAYYSFLAIPSLLLVAVGVFSLVAGPDAIDTIIDRIGTVAPAEAVTLLEDSLRRTTEGGGGVAMVSVGAVLALWTATGAINAVMRALNTVYDREEQRGFVKQRLVAVVMLAAVLAAFLLVFGLLVLGPQLSGWVGDAVGLEGTIEWIWWSAQWPILIGGLLLAFAAVLFLGPDVDHPRWRFLTLGAVIAVLVWLAASGAFAWYVASFGSYDKTWGSLAAVIIMLVWIWLSAVVLLFGAEVNAELERSRELRRGEPAERRLQAPVTS